MKAGETAEEALRREVREETAVEVAPRTLIMVYDLIDRDADGRVRYHYAVLDFLADYVAGDPMPGSDVVHAAWLALRDLPEYDVTPGAMAILERALRYRRG
jgi:ADP-ribose pyrophosphatase YjhB (NUDIX family)